MSSDEVFRYGVGFVAIFYLVLFIGFGILNYLGVI